MKSLFSSLVVLVLIALSGCSNSPPSEVVNKTAEKNVLAYTADKFTVSSVKTVSSDKDTVDMGDYKVNRVGYILDVSIAAKQTCYTEKPEQKVVKYAPSCITDKEIADATAETNAALANPGGVGNLSRSVASAMVVGQSKNVDRQHPVAAGSEFTIKNVNVVCAYDHSLKNPTWACEVPRN
jgi:hypothetical protein